MQDLNNFLFENPYLKPLSLLPIPDEYRLEPHLKPHQHHLPMVAPRFVQNLSCEKALNWPHNLKRHHLLNIVSLTPSDDEGISPNESELSPVSLAMKLQHPYETVQALLLAPLLSALVSAQDLN